MTNKNINYIQCCLSVKKGVREERWQKKTPIIDTTISTVFNRNKESGNLYFVKRQIYKKMKAKLENYNGIDYLTFKVNDEIGLTQLPVITKGTRQGTNAWTWNGDLEKPTLRPSIRTVYPKENGEMTEIHYWLTSGIVDCLGDCKDGNSGKKLTLLECD